MTAGPRGGKSRRNDISSNSNSWKKGRGPDTDPWFAHINNVWISLANVWALALLSLRAPLSAFGKCRWCLSYFSTVHLWALVTETRAAYYKNGRALDKAQGRRSNYFKILSLADRLEYVPRFLQKVNLQLKKTCSPKKPVFPKL